MFVVIVYAEPLGLRVLTRMVVLRSPFSVSDIGMTPVRTTAAVGEDDECRHPVSCCNFHRVLWHTEDVISEPVLMYNSFVVTFRRPLRETICSVAGMQRPLAGRLVRRPAASYLKITSARIMR